MSNNVEKIIEKVLTNEKYLKSDKRLNRLILSNLPSGVVSVYGRHNVGKKLFVINMIINILEHNNAEVLFVTDKASKEEMAIRIATSMAGANPFTLAITNGVDKAINKHMNFNEKIKVIEKSEYVDGLIKEFVGRSKAKHKILVYDTASSDDLTSLKELSTEMNLITIATVLYPNDYDMPNYKILNNIHESSDVVVRIEESYLDYKKECMEVCIVKNKIKEQDKIKLVVKQQRQRIYEPYETGVYLDEDDLPF